MASHANGEDNDSGEQLSEQLTSPTALRKLVLNYLIHYCYIDTAQAFAHDGISTSTAIHSNGEAPTINKAISGGSSRKPGEPSQPVASGSSLLQTRSGSRVAATQQAHPLSAPPLSREDSSMEIEVDSLLSLAAGRRGGEGGGGGGGFADGIGGHDENGPAKAISTQEDTQMGGDETNYTTNGTSEKEKEGGSEELSAEELRSVRMRKEIKEHILNGRIKLAIDICNAHFPAVLNAEPLTSIGGETEQGKNHKAAKETTDSSVNETSRVLPANPTSLYPAHLSLNLQIQAFIESVRLAFTAAPSNGATTQNFASFSSDIGLMAGTTPHSLAASAPGITAAANAISRSASPAPSSASSNGSNASANGLSGSAHSNGGPATLNPFLHAALSHAVVLNTNVQKLPPYWRSMYLKELNNVMVLLAYTDLERSPVRKYLDQSRRVALAEQINSAIMFRTGKPSQPLIESAVRQTSFLWSSLSGEKVVVPSDHPIFTSGTVVGIDKFESQSTSGASTERLKTKGKILPPWNLHNFLQER